MTIRIIYTDGVNEVIPDVVSVDAGTHHLTVVRMVQGRRRRRPGKGKSIFAFRQRVTSYTVWARGRNIRSIWCGE